MQWSGADAAPRILIRRKLTLLLDRLCFAEGWLCCWAIVVLLTVSWPCDEAFYFAGWRVLRDSSSGVERLHIPSDWES
ncbi:hypothetical protein CDL15_Pgr009197 [Punica granatum]|uniref:Uncharacterized protein n=1 Tax=Punica granatum TaxID=22663 RepID=A0A218WX66_PUNGR|nr:hypothetical protein CDL15_Pgr009197 [Punica granatum]